LKFETVHVHARRGRLKLEVWEVVVIGGGWGQRRIRGVVPAHPVFEGAEVERLFGLDGWGTLVLCESVAVLREDDGVG